MISSIFGKTKPINYIILLVFLFVFYWVVHLFIFKMSYSLETLAVQTAVLGVLLFSVFVVNFIVKRNKITGTNSFAILFYTLLFIVFPEVLMDSNAILCSFFLLLSTRRLLSIKSLREIKSKVFDATLWVAMASLFYDWALVYILLVFIAIYLYEPKNFRNWLVPFAGAFTVLMIAICFLLLTGNIEFLEKHYTFSFAWVNDYFLTWANSAKLMVYMIIISIAGILGFINMGKPGLGRIVTMRLVAISYFMGLGLTILKSSNTVFPVILTFFPAVIFLTNYIEAIKKPNIKEILLIISILLPLVILSVGVLI